jgi:soluble lytic murein transglycosylase-like protein
MIYREMIRSAGHAHSIDPKLLEAMVLKESNGNPWAWNPEPHYRYLWNVKTRAPFRPLTPEEVKSEVPPKDFPCLAGDRDQEWWAQQASWGLLQLMGAVARERGFRGNYIPEICDPALNLDLGAKHLKSALQWAQGDVRIALAGYNAGRGGGAAQALLRADGYPDAVLQFYQQIP